MAVPSLFECVYEQAVTCMVATSVCGMGES